jgi:hypothetical protein
MRHHFLRFESGSWVYLNTDTDSSNKINYVFCGIIIVKDM